ncbi:TPA: hypothetical protein KES88_001171 [Enterococcus faecalis]|nr:hypothetical protein [Enterococcus faecalis]HBK3297667.1 hypothetical protein [Enterococcus faecalis]
MKKYLLFTIFHGKIISVRKGETKERTKIKKLTLTKKRSIQLIIATLAVLGILLAMSFHSQNRVKSSLNYFNERWKEIESEGNLDLSLLNPKNNKYIPLTTGKKMDKENKTNFLPSRFEKQKQIKRISHDEQLLSDLGNEYSKAGNIGDTSKEFSIEDEQKRLDKMYAYFDGLTTEGKNQFKPVKDSLDRAKKSLEIISDYNKSYYIPIEKSDLIPTAYKFPLNTDVANQYCKKISDELDYSYDDYNPNADTEENTTSDIRETDWDNGAYGILSWGESLYRYYLDLKGRPEAVASFENNLNLGDTVVSDAFSDMIEGQFSKKEMEKQDPNDMSEEELSRNLIYSLASMGYYERATQDDDKTISSVITPSSWVLQKDDKIVLKASFNSIQENHGTDTFFATYSMTDTKTKESFDITIKNNDNGSYHVTGQTPAGEINHDYTPISNKSTKKADSSTSEEVLSSANVSKETMDNATIESYCHLFSGKFITNNLDNHTASYFNESPKSWRFEDSSKLLITAEFLGVANSSADGTVQFKMRDKESSKEFLLNITPNSDWDGYKLQADTPVGNLTGDYIAVTSNKNTRQKQSDKAYEEKQQNQSDGNKNDTDPKGEKSLQGYTGEDATNPFD